MTPNIRPARSSEASHLSDLAFRSKAVWGYSDEFMNACRGELAVSEETMSKNPTFVLEEGGVAVGFYSLIRMTAERADLGHLFVDPGRLGQGHGRTLLDHARQQARTLGYRELEIQGDPNAEAFYVACGAVPIGMLPSDSIPGRQLPLFELKLD